MVGVFILLPGSAVTVRQSSCLTCHKSHNTEQESCVGCHRGNDRTDRKEIAHHDIITGRFTHFTIKGGPVMERGKKLVDVLACRRCHIHGGKGNRLAINLTRLSSNTAPQGIFDSVKSPVLFMPNFYCDDMQITAIVNAILDGADSAGAKGRKTAQVVHFEDEKQSIKNVFAKQCGSCHKALSERSGGLGNGDIGPNLSGLLSEYYPRTYRYASPWTPDKLKKWLENPRNMRVNARMKPMRFAAGEFDQLMETMRINSEDEPLFSKR